MRPAFDYPMNAPAAPRADLPRSSHRSFFQIFPVSRNVLIALAVVLLHIGLIWALQSGLLRRSVELLVPATVLAQFIEPPARIIEPALPVPPATRPTPTPAAQKKAATKVPPPQQQPPAPQPVAIADPSPTPSAAAVVVPPVPPSAPAPVAATESAPPSVQLPTSDADYLQNPKPPYPPLSMRLGETGKVVYKVWIGADGKAERAELVKSSGFARLDSAAYDTVMRWRYVPGKRNGVAQAMPFNVPINWELRN
jgi:periplasmic protein TonB